MKKILIGFSFLLFAGFVSAQQKEEMVPEMNTQPWAKNFMEGLDIGGYYRFIFNDRQYENPYNDLGATRSISVIDPTYYDPMLFLYVGGNPTPNSSFGAELRLDSYMMGASKVTEGGLSLFNGLVLRGNTKTKKAGDYDIRFGGIEWMNISPFTFGSNTGFDRYSIFERRPWDPGGNVMQRPGDYFHTNRISQDVRFGTQAFKGLSVNVYDLPEDMTANIIYGRSQNFSGVDPEDEVAPKKIYGGKLEKLLGDYGTVGISTYHTVSYQDSIQRDYDTRSTFRMVEGLTTLNFKKFSVFGELGYGVNTNPEEDGRGGFAILADLKTSKSLTYFPISLRLYKIDPYFINLDSYIGNTTTTSYLQNLQLESAGVFLPNSARLTNSGDLVNNRIGTNLSTDIHLGPLKLITGIELSKDQERFSETNELTYAHRINGLEISRLVTFPNAGGDFGPNSRMNTSFRGAYESVTVGDSTDDGGMLNELYYTTVDVQLKYSTQIAGKDLYVFNLNTFSAVNNKAFYNNAYINARYHEFEAYYSIWRDLNVSLYYGLERVKGNDKTDWELQEDGVTEANRDQTGNSFGIGLDYQLNDKTFLYMRQRWFNFNDKNFEGENFDGKRLSLEMKIFF